jgi:NAD(P)-dependent dehydrogenase (short-subunit alcohol dehydrogenase family)
MSRLAGKVAIITGGASGIGRGAVELFLREGAQVVAADIQDDKGALLVDELGPSVSYFRADVGEEREVEALVADTVKRHGRLDCLFNNAGLAGVSGPITETPFGEAEVTFQVLFWSVVFGMKYAGRVMRDQKSGSIISTASVAGVGTGMGPHIYSAAKAAVIHLTRSVAKELGESNVRVNCICPGGIATPIFGKGAGLGTQAADQTVETVKGLLAHMQPIPRAGLPEDIAKAALFLASDDSTFVNGHALVVDGGLTHGRRWSEVVALRQAFRTALGVQD